MMKWIKYLLFFVFAFTLIFYPVSRYNYAHSRVNNDLLSSKYDTLDKTVSNSQNLIDRIDQL